MRTRSNNAFTLIEMLVVIAIAGIIAALAVPAVKEFGRSNSLVAATRQMMDEVGRARQLAISQRTTVYLAFLPNGYQVGTPLYTANFSSIPTGTAQYQRAYNLKDDQGRGYAIVSLRSIGDQLGQSKPRYLVPWQALPQGWIIAPLKFRAPNLPESSRTLFTNWDGTPVLDGNGHAVRVGGFETNSIPFPDSNSPNADTTTFPCVIFNHLGQVVDQSGNIVSDTYIPLARGTVDAAPEPGFAEINEVPPNNSMTDYNIVHIDGLTGRARLIRREVQ